MSLGGADVKRFVARSSGIALLLMMMIGAGTPASAQEPWACAYVEPVRMQACLYDPLDGSLVDDVPTSGEAAATATWYATKFVPWSPTWAQRCASTVNPSYRPEVGIGGTDLPEVTVVPGSGGYLIDGFWCYYYASPPMWRS
jgi:hypothetical protein